jgi:hypothetical protein
MLRCIDKVGVLEASQSAVLSKCIYLLLVGEIAVDSESLDSLDMI